MPLIETVINAVADVSKSFIGQSAFGITVESVITVGVVLAVGGWLIKQMGYDFSFQKKK